MLGCCNEAGANRNLMQICSYDFQIVHICDRVSNEVFFPNWRRGLDMLLKAALDQADGLLECDRLRCKQKMRVVRHNYEGMEFVVAEHAIVQQQIDKLLRNSRDLEHRVSTVCRQRNERDSGACCAQSFRHVADCRSTEGESGPCKRGCCRIHNKSRSAACRKTGGGRSISSAGPTRWRVRASY